MGTSAWKEILKRWRARSAGYKDIDGMASWFLDRADRIRDLFNDPHIKTIVFGQLKSAFDAGSAKTEDQVRATITQVALANAVMAALPGWMGVGVFVSTVLGYRPLALETDSPVDERYTMH